MVTEQNTEIIRRLYREVTSKKAPETGIKSGVYSFTQYTTSFNKSGLKTFRKFFRSVGEAFPNYALTIENLITKEDRVMVLYTISGIQRNTFLGKTPTNKQTTIRGIDIFRLNNGKVVEYCDAAHQINALPRSNLNLSNTRDAMKSGVLINS